MEVVIPAIADDVQEAEILALLVRVGQHVLADQPVLELEAGKASFELPSPATGQIEEILVGIGDDVKVGDVVLTLRTIEDQLPVPPEPAEPTAAVAPFQPTPRATYVRASPAARRRARELKIDLDALAAEFHGRVTIEQIEARAGGCGDPSDSTLDERDDLAITPLREPASGEWRSLLHDTIDVTSLEAARRRYRDEHEIGPRLTLIVFVLKACAIALREHPRMNSSLIRQGRALAIKRYVHIGVTGETDRGFGVPVIKHADRRSLCELADDLEALTDSSRAPADADHFEAPTFSITHLRGFGATRFPPVIHPPQVGTLGLCRARGEAGRVSLPISLAYDRRVNDDDAAGSFLTTVAELLHDPIAMLMRS